MAGDITMVEHWTGCDIYVAALATTGPANVDAVWPVGWDQIGFIDGEDGVGEEIEESVDNVFAWGGAFLRELRRNQLSTFMFTALENNDVTWELMNPHADPDEIRVRRPVPQMLGMEFRGELPDGTPSVERLITAEYAIISYTPAGRNEQDIVRHVFTAKIVPDTSVDPPRLFNRQHTVTAS